MSKEAFVYLWHDELNKMYYLGKHKGSPKDKYTHSSTIWESFTKDNIPEGVTRRILAYGTDEEMCILEHELLVNRKKRCWNKYYNESLGDPRYVDMSGENNPMYGRGAEFTGENNPHWKGGITYDMKAYRSRPEYKEYHKEYHKEYDKEYKQSPKYLSYEQTPERKAYKKEYDAERYAKKKLEAQS